MRDLRKFRFVRLLVRAVFVAALLATPTVATAAVSPQATLVEVSRARSLPKGISAAHRRQLLVVIAALKRGDTRRADAAWYQFARRYFNAKTKRHAKAINAYVIRQAFLVTNPRLSALADRLRYNAELQRAIKKHAAALASAARAAKSKGSVRVEVIEFRTKYSPGKPMIRRRTKQNMSAKLAAKRAEIMEAAFDEAIDEAKANYEQAKEQFKKALRILIETQERHTQVIQKITS